MLEQLIKTAWRNLRKNGSSSLITISGLCVSLTAGMLLLLSVGYEFSYDRFHVNAGSIYHLYLRIQRPNGPEVTNVLPVPILPALRQEFPGIINGSRSENQESIVRYKGKKIAQTLMYADTGFFSIFTFPVLKGNFSQPLRSLHDVVLTKALSISIFGAEDPIGKIVEYQIGNTWKPFSVSAIVDDCPVNSSIRYDAVVLFDNFPDYEQLSTAWDWRITDVFIQLGPHDRLTGLVGQLPSFTSKYFSENIRRLVRDGMKADPHMPLITVSVQPLAEMHTSPEISGAASSISRSYLYVLAIIGGLIIFIGCINYINFSAGRFFTRSKEVAVRKTLGASKWYIALQFWMETILIFLIAFLFSCVISFLILPQYKLLFGMNIQRSILFSLSSWLYLSLGFVLLTSLAGLFPALQIARVNVIAVMKGKLNLKTNASLRNVLITLQFTIAVFLISCTVISWQQIHFLLHQPLGYDATHVISVPLTGEIDRNQALRLMRDNLSSAPGVASVSGIYDNFGIGRDGSNRTSELSFDYEGREIKSDWIGVSYDFVRTMDLQLLQGRDFSPVLLTDSNSVLINEEMAKQLGGKKVLGARLSVDSAKPLVVIGIVKNFYFKSLKKKIAPVCFVLDKDFSINYILIKVSTHNLSESMQTVRRAWQDIAPGTIFQGSYLDENVNRQYNRERKLMQIFSMGTFIAILISSIGLFSMVILITSQRLREISLRRVLGASIRSIVTLIAGDFLMMTLISVLIASPLVWYFMYNWLQTFAYHIAISWTVFLFSVAILVTLVLVTVGLKSIKAARTNPARVLRSE